MCGGKQAGPGYRCKRNGRQQLWIIGEPVALEGSCPCMIEYIFAAGVRLQIQGHGAIKPVSPMQQQVMRCPPGFGSRAPGLLQRQQECMTYQGMVASQFVPPFGVNIVQIAGEGEGGRQGYGFIEFDEWSAECNAAGCTSAFLL